MSPRTSAQFEEIRDQKRKLILDTALDLFASKGYYNTSINDIARKAGISKGLMYNYFGSKEELIETIIFNGVDEIMEILDKDGDGKLSHDELLSFLDSSFEIFKKKISFWRVYFSILMKPQVYSMAKGKLAGMSDPVMNMFEDYFRSVRSNDPITEARIFYCLLDGIALNYVINPEGFPIARVNEMIHKLFIR